jgi:hypothetical protein
VKRGPAAANSRCDPERASFTTGGNSTPGDGGVATPGSSVTKRATTSGQVLPRPNSSLLTTPPQHTRVEEEDPTCQPR